MNLLLITQVYPDEKGVKTARNSNVCHYWTKEWVKMGHQVHVIYLYSQYLPILHKIATICPHFISQFTNGTLTRPLKGCLSYKLDGVCVYKIPMYKPIPKIRYRDSVIREISAEITSYLQRIGMDIDLIIGHFDNPVLEIGGICKTLLHVPFVFVLHGYPSDIKRLYPRSYEKLIKEVDLWGFRSISIKKDFESHYGELKKYFIAYSGIPEAYLPKEKDRLQKEKRKICYVGALIRRKYPEIVIKALVPFLQKGEMSISYIGEGALSKKIQSIAKKAKIQSKINLLGYVSRECVQQELESSEYFVMISRHETFGMVYLEAMAHGCITIASRGEGFDGIIKDGVNGFLCNAGDKQELQRIFSKIESMDECEKEKIRKAAISTAIEMTEHKMADKYLMDVNKLIKE